MAVENNRVQLSPFLKKKKSTTYMTDCREAMYLRNKRRKNIFEGMGF